MFIWIDGVPPSGVVIGAEAVLAIGAVVFCGLVVTIWAVADRLVKAEGGTQAIMLAKKNKLPAMHRGFMAVYVEPTRWAICARERLSISLRD